MLINNKPLGRDGTVNCIVCIYKSGGGGGGGGKNKDALGLTH